MSKIIPDVQLNRGLPFKNESEQAVLGSLLLDPINAVPHTLGYLQPNDFHVPAHRIIFEAMMRLHRRGDPLDIVLIIKEIGDSDKLTGVGGFSYLGALIEMTPTAANVKYYAKIIKAETDRRQRILQAAEDIEDAFRRPRAVGKGFVKLADVLHGVMEEAYSNATQGRYSGFSTGFAAVDEHLGGLQRGELYIVAGRPSQGKSALCTQIASNIFQAGGRVAFFPLEAGLKGQTRNLASMATEIDGWKLRVGKGNYQTDAESAQLRAYLDVQRQGVFTLSGAKTPHDINAVLREILVDHGGLDAIFIDHLQEMQSSDSGKFTPRHLQIESILQDIRVVAREFAIPVILAAQIGRAAEGREPTLAEIKDSGSIEQIADVVMIIHGQERGAGLRTLNIAKNRNGSTGKGNLWLEGKYLKFTEA